MISQAISQRTGILRPCSIPGCSALTAGGPCQSHRVARQREHDVRRGSSCDRGYDAYHRRLRILCFQRDDWRCVDCGWEPDIVADCRRLRPWRPARRIECSPSFAPDTTAANGTCTPTIRFRLLSGLTCDSISTICRRDAIAAIARRRCGRRRGGTGRAGSNRWGLSNRDHPRPPYENPGNSIRGSKGVAAIQIAGRVETGKLKYLNRVAVYRRTMHPIYGAEI